MQNTDLVIEPAKAFFGFRRNGLDSSYSYCFHGVPSGNNVEVGISDQEHGLIGLRTISGRFDRERK